MEYLENLNSFLISVSNFCRGEMVGLTYKFPPDTTTQLSKQKPTYGYSSFNIGSIGGCIEFEKFVREEKKIQVYEIRIGTYPGTLRLSNSSYPQNQLVTRKAFGLNIDIVPRKNTNTDIKQLIIINDFKLIRVGQEPYTPNFLTPDMERKIDEHNSRNRSKKPTNISPSILNRVEGDRVPTIVQLLTTINETLFSTITQQT